MEIVYATRRVPEADGRRFINPRFFRGVVPGVTRAFVSSDLPRIAEAYRAAGVPVVIIGFKPRTAVPEPSCGLLDRISARLDEDSQC